MTEAKDVAAYNLTVEKTEENDTIKKTNEKEGLKVFFY